MYLQRLQNSIKDLDGSSDLVSGNHKGITPVALEAIKQAGYPPMSEDLLKLAKDCDQFTFYWSWPSDDSDDDSDDGESYSGEIGLISLTKAFSEDWDGIIWFDEDVYGTEFPKEEYTFARNMHPFDHLEESMQSTRVIAFYIDKEKLDPSQPLNPEIWVYNTDNVKFKLTLNYSQYLDRLLETRGFVGWQLFFMDWDGMDFKDPFIKNLFGWTRTEDMEEFLKGMPKVFPDQDLSEYKELYKNWKKKARQHGF